jgi:exodeoxyribonuclease VII large subunit
MSSLFDLPFEEPTSADASVGKPEPAETGAKPVREPRRVFSVSELTGEIRLALEERFVEIWVEGELSNCRVWNTGHLYFTLKDETAQIKGVMFRSALRYLRFKPQDGLRVVARGRVSVYDPKGEYQIVCEHLEPRGWARYNSPTSSSRSGFRRRGCSTRGASVRLPALPRKIGIVTSLEGAAVRDIIQVLRRRYPNAHLVIRPTRVQGEGSALEIARAIRAIGKVKGVDVVIVGRGGGSIEDLWAFNEEVVARAIAGCPVPTISAVGHETDVTIADFVADLRAPTPSAAAEMVVSRKDDFCARIDRLAHGVQSAMQTRVHRLESRLRALEARPGRALLSQLAARGRLYQSMRRKLDTFDIRVRLGGVRSRLVAADSRLGGALTRKQHAADARLRSTAARLEALSPLAVLGRGYAVCWNADHTAIIRDASKVSAGERVHVKVERGELDCNVTDTHGSDH